VTRGSFYFVERSQRVLSVPHPFFSACWTEGDEIREERFGPIPGAPRTWKRGAIGFAPPPGLVVGDPFALRNGGRIPTDVNAGQTRGGIPLTCWTNFRWPFEPWHKVSSIEDCCLQRAYARIVQLTYAEDFDTLQDFFQTWLGPAATILPVPQVGLMPAGIVVSTDAYSLCCVSGTVNFQQLAIQAAAGITRPMSVGAFSTDLLWEEAANWFSEKIIQAGTDGVKPMLLIGHSYGAAAMAVLAGKMRHAQPGRQIALLTYGMPKPGDERLQKILRSVSFRHLCNRGDLVCLVPPSANQVGTATTAFYLVALLSWDLWKGASQYKFLWSNGRVTYGTLDQEVEPTWDDLVRELENAISVPPIVPHFIEEYLRRLAMNCACPNTFISREAWNVLFNRILAAQAGLLLGQDEGMVAFEGSAGSVAIDDGTFNADQEPRGGTRIGGGRVQQTVLWSHGTKLGNQDGGM